MTEKIPDSPRPLQSQEKEGGKQPYKVDYTEAKFHIIDSDTSDNALIGRPWIHEYRTSTLHQCMKYQRDGVEYCIQGDTQPFAVYEIGLYEDAEHYLPRQQGEDGPRKPASKGST